MSLRERVKLELEFLRERVSSLYCVCLLVIAFVLGASLYEFDKQGELFHGFVVLVWVWATYVVVSSNEKSCYKVVKK